MIAFLALGLARAAHAVDLSQSFHFDGQLVNDSTGVPLASPVSAVFKILDPSGNCLLYEESHAALALDSQGGFSVKIGPGGSGVRNTSADGGLLWKIIFQNLSQLRSPGAPSCSPGYTPAAGDGRKLRVVINGSALSPDYAMASTPMATVAESLQGKVPTDFLPSSGNIALNGNFKLNAQSEMRFSDASTYYVGLRAPASLGSNQIWTLPNADGTAGQCLQTDGVGNLSWATVSGGGGTMSSLNGIATATQSFAVGSSGISPAWSSGGSTHTLQIPMASAAAVTAGLISKADYDNFNSKMSNAGGVLTGNLTTTGSFQSASGSAANVGFQSGAANTGMFSPAANSLGFSAGGVESVRIDASGNVGVGTTSPVARLEVAGQVKISGGSPGSGKVLTSDATGLANWQTPAAPLSGSTAVGTYTTLGANANGTGTAHTAVGYQAGYNYTGGNSVIVGYQAAGAGGSGAGNTLVGASVNYLTAVSGNFNTVVGNSANVSASVSNAIAIGKGAQVNGSGGVAIGVGAVAPANSIVIGTNNGGFQERMRIDPAGNVGIGTSTPTAVLDVAGPVSLGSGGPEVRVGGPSVAPISMVDSQTVNNTGGFGLSGSVGTGASAQGSASMSGNMTAVSPGDNVICSPFAGSGAVSGFITWSCYVSSPGNISIQVSCGSGGGSCTLPTDWRVTVIRW